MRVLGYKSDLYFHKHKLAIEVDEWSHTDRNLDYETERQKALGKELVSLLELTPMKKISKFLKK